MVTQFIAGPWTDPVVHQAFVEARMRHVCPPGMGYWTVLAPEGFAGWILLTPLNLHGPEIEIGWRLVRAFWGRGYATEAARPVLSYALTTIGLAEVVADIDPANHASARVAHKLGLCPVKPMPYGGRMVDRYVIGPRTAYEQLATLTELARVLHGHRRRRQAPVHSLRKRLTGQVGGDERHDVRGDVTVDVVACVIKGGRLECHREGDGEFLRWQIRLH